MEENTTKPKKRRRINRQWLGTLLASTIGIVIGIGLTDAYENWKLTKKKNYGLTQVENEVKGNKEQLQEFRDTMAVSWEPFKQVIFTLFRDDNFEIVVPADELATFLDETQPVLNNVSTEKLAGDSVLVDGHLFFNFDVESYIFFTGLAEVNWQTFLQSNYQSVTEFSCLESLEELYSFQTNISEKILDWMDVFLEIASGNTNESELYDYDNPAIREKNIKLYLDLFNKGDKLIQEMDILLEFYQQFDEEYPVSCKGEKVKVRE